MYTCVCVFDIHCIIQNMFLIESRQPLPQLSISCFLWFVFVHDDLFVFSSLENHSHSPTLYFCILFHHYSVYQIIFPIYLYAQHTTYNSILIISVCLFVIYHSTFLVHSFVPSLPLSSLSYRLVISCTAEHCV
jgi:hypothetical protein